MADHFKSVKRLLDNSEEPSLERKDSYRERITSLISSFRRVLYLSRTDTCLPVSPDFFDNLSKFMIT
jgi:hypothetical protein